MVVVVVKARTISENGQKQNINKNSNIMLAVVERTKRCQSAIKRWLYKVIDGGFDQLFQYILNACCKALCCSHHQ